MVRFTPPFAQLLTLFSSLRQDGAPLATVGRPAAPGAPAAYARGGAGPPALAAAPVDDVSARVWSAEDDQRALAIRCVDRFVAVGYGSFGKVTDVTCRMIQGLWAGTGSVVELTARSETGDKLQFIAKLIGPPDDPTEHESRRDHHSFYVEASFFDQGHAERVAKAGATVPLGLVTERLDNGRVNIAMTKLTGRPRPIDDARTRAALLWLARLHALYWGRERSDAAVASGLQPQGCFWHFDTRQLEFDRMPRKGPPPGLANLIRSAASP